PITRKTTCTCGSFPSACRGVSYARASSGQRRISTRRTQRRKLIDPSCPEVARRPVAGAEALDADDAGRAGGVDKLIAANGDPHVRRAGRDCSKEEKIARRQLLAAL